MKRLFFALWPDDETREQCVSVIKALSSKDGRLVPPGNLHVTLAFLGNIDAATELSVTQAAAKIPVSQMAITFDRINFWRKPGILCLTAQNPDPTVTSLAMSLISQAAQFGIPVDPRPFTPHVTLVRKVKRSAQLEFDPVIWSADSFCLMESCSLPEGVEYRVIKYWR